MKWYESIITKEMAESFFDECESYSTESIINGCKELIHQWPLSNKLLPDKKYKPTGAIISTSETPSQWNALHMLATHMYSSHFFINSSNHASYYNSYDMLRDFNCQIFMLHRPTDYIAHAGFMSQRAFGIELRNVSKLRPYPHRLTPTPLSRSDETDKNFKCDPIIKYSAYWRLDQWRMKFPGDVVMWEDYIYEHPSVYQIHALIAVLRCLHTLYGLDPSLIIPINCVHEMYPCLPTVPWNFIRECAIAPGRIYIDESPVMNHFKQYNNRSRFSWENKNLDYEDESLLADIMETSRWRSEMDDGQFEAFDNNLFIQIASFHKRQLSRLGYSTNNPSKDLMLWACARGIMNLTIDDICNRFNYDSPYINTLSR